METTNMGDSLCRCVSEKAGTEMTEVGLSFLVAVVSEDDTEADRLRSEVSMEEAVKAAMFMTKAPASCAAEEYESQTQ